MFSNNMANLVKINEFINYHYSTKLGLFVSDTERIYIYSVQNILVLVSKYFEVYKNKGKGYWVRKDNRIVHCNKLGIETINKLRLTTYDLKLTLLLLLELEDYLRHTSRSIIYFEKLEGETDLYKINRLITT
jgi:hypothetical protein